MLKWEFSHLNEDDEMGKVFTGVETKKQLSELCGATAYNDTLLCLNDDIFKKYTEE